MGASKTWDFLGQFYDQPRTPIHFKLSIEAISLAYLAHEVYSDLALVVARDRYSSALRLRRNCLKSPEVASSETTLLASLRGWAPNFRHLPSTYRHLGSTNRRLWIVNRREYTVIVLTSTLTGTQLRPGMSFVWSGSSSTSLSSDTAGESNVGVYSHLIKYAMTHIENLAYDIVASIPQYISYHGASKGSQSESKVPLLSGEAEIVQDISSHPHVPSRSLDCYTLMFALFVAGRSIGIPKNLKLWIVDQLYYISSHFSIPNASVLAQILEQGININPWTFYATLGSYAFVA